MRGACAARSARRPTPRTSRSRPSPMSAARFWSPRSSTPISRSICDAPPICSASIRAGGGCRHPVDLPGPLAEMLASRSEPDGGLISSQSACARSIIARRSISPSAISSAPCHRAHRSSIPPIATACATPSCRLSACAESLPDRRELLFGEFAALAASAAGQRPPSTVSSSAIPTA